MARIGIIGSEGAMGQALAGVIDASDHEWAGGIDRGGDAASLADASDVLVDFSSPQALDANLHAAIGRIGHPRQGRRRCDADCQ